MKNGTVASPGPATAAGRDSSYAVQRDRVDAAQRRMHELGSAPHDPGLARQATEELTEALRTATTMATCGLKAVAPADLPRARRRLYRRKATRSVAADVRPWLMELARLAEIGVWMRRAGADDPGVLVPTAVRVGSRAATGPHVAGLVAEPLCLTAATLHESRIGVDLQAIVDRHGGQAP